MCDLSSFRAQLGQGPGRLARVRRGLGWGAAPPAPRRASHAAVSFSLWTMENGRGRHSSGSVSSLRMREGDKTRVFPMGSVNSFPVFIDVFWVSRGLELWPRCSPPWLRGADAVSGSVQGRGGARAQGRCAGAAPAPCPGSVTPAGPERPVGHRGPSRPSPPPRLCTVWSPASSSRPSGEGLFRARPASGSPLPAGPRGSAAPLLGRRRHQAESAVSAVGLGVLNLECVTSSAVTQTRRVDDSLPDCDSLSVSST